jgi:hypothetical protein
MPPRDLYAYLFKDFPMTINGITAKVPSLWTGRPEIDGLQEIEVAYPDAKAVTARVQPAINIINDFHFVTKDGTEKTNAKPMTDLISEKKAGWPFKLVRDHNGEYAPAIAGILSGGLCTIVAGEKPSSIKASIAEAKLAIVMDDCPEEDNEANAWLKEKIRTSGKAKAYAEVESGKCAALAAGLTAPLDLKVTIGEVSGPVAMSSLHQYWTSGPLPKRFFDRVGQWVMKRQSIWNVWGTLTYQAAPAMAVKPEEKKVEKGEKIVKKSTSPDEGSTVKKAPEFTFLIWVRRQEPVEHTHNMGQDLLYEIVTAISQVCKAIYGAGATYRFVLCGDSTAATVASLPVHAEDVDKGVAKAITALGSKTKKNLDKTIPEFVRDVFLAVWTDQKPATLMISDCRDLYSAAKFTTPSPTELGAVEDLPAAPEVPKKAKKSTNEDKEQAALEDKANEKKFNEAMEAYKEALKKYEKAIQDHCADNVRAVPLTYVEQYAFFMWLAAKLKPRFIIGAESGNMDGFGYCGIPVISIDVDDPVEALDAKILEDRIGQYMFLTPLWSLLNYEKGADVALFRQHLYGSVLYYTYYGNNIHTSKATPKTLEGNMSVDEGLKNLIAFSGDVFDEQEALDAEVVTALGDEFDIVNATGDGNCLFRAVSRVRVGNEGNHALYRQRAVRRAAQMFDLVTICAGSGVFASLVEYRAVMGVPAEGAHDLQRYGGHIEIAGLAVEDSITIRVYSPGNLGNPVVVNPGQVTTVNILYVNRNHYKALIP